jgi:hypothetical protein
MAKRGLVSHEQWNTAGANLSIRTIGFGQDIPFNPPSKTWFDFGTTNETKESNDLQQQQQQLEQVLQRSSISSMHTDVYDRDWLLK